MTADEVLPEEGVDILIVEDSLTQAMKLQHILERRQHRAVIARDGAEALGLLEKTLPRMVISDINMPKMNGYELCARIKDDARTKELPVILLTALSDPRDILKGLECGADNFIVKPYDEEFLLSRIQHVLANQELRKQAEGKRVTEIFFAGHKYQLTSERIHSIDLLLSTYETAVQKNLELTKAKELLEAQAEELRAKNAEMAADLEMARELQTAFLPQKYPAFPEGAAPGRSALKFSHRYSTTTELGGDFFDVSVVSPTEAGVLICDVMGHGVRAALVTAIVRGLNEELSANAREPGQFLTEMNAGLREILKQTLTPLFATAFYAVVDVASRTIRYANAGHPFPFHLRRARDRVERLEPDEGKPGRALGVFEGSAYRTSQRTIETGDLLMLFTDGLFEVEAPGGEFFDQRMLEAAVASRIRHPAEQLCDELIAEVKEFGAMKDFEDDVCIVAIEVASGEVDKAAG